MYQALYRTWRPRVFEDVVGQDAITTTLKNEVKTGKVAHAYLFTGSRGTGKTTCSRILAKAVNCPNAKDGDPCGECEICKGIDEGSMLDVLEIDAASNNSVDNVRDLREEANFTPVACKFRVYIMDEIHMLSQSAFNALLKIMEEPPEHVLFILATTEVHKVPATILSRCQRFDFQRIPSADIAKRLEYIAQQEQIPLTHEAAMLIARLSDGGMRDAISLLDLCSSNANEITEQVVQNVAGLASSKHLLDLILAIEQQDCSQVMRLVDQLYQGSVDVQRLCEEMVSQLRNLMLMKTVKNPQDFVVCTRDELESMQAAAQKIKLSTVLRALSAMQETLNRLARCYSQRIELEMTLISLASPLEQTDTRAILARIEELERAVQNGQAAPWAQQAMPSAAPGTTPGAPLQKRTGEGEIPPHAPPAPEEAPSMPKPAAEAPAQAQDIHSQEAPQAIIPFAQWDKVLARLQETNPPLAAVLLNSRAFVQGNLLLIDSPGRLDLLKKGGYAKDSLRAAAQELTGVRYRLGPYKSVVGQQASAPAAPIDEMENALRAQGLEIEEK